MRFVLIILICLLFNFHIEGYGKTIINFNSGNKKVHILELYTSQACSSCPSAEKWLNQLRNSTDLWNKIIPLEFHVSYWNHLNWIDSHSKDEFNDRQRRYDQVNRSGVYTPQILLNGENYHSWRRKNHEYGDNQLSPGILKVK